MKLSKKNSRFIAFVLVMVTCNTYSMEPLAPKEKKTSKLRRFQAWVANTGQALLGNVPIQELPFLKNKNKDSSSMGLPKELVDQIILFLSISTTAKSLNIAADAIRSLSLVNHELNELINDHDFCLKLIKNLAKKFNCSHMDAARALKTTQAQQQIKLQRQLIDVLNQAEISERDFMILCDKGVDLEFTNGGYTQLMIAALMNEDNVIRFLLNHNADINGFNFRGETALMIAAKLSGADIVTLLATAPHVAIDQQDIDGNTALLLAITEHLYIPEVITKILLSAGADPELANFAGLTPLIAAQKQGDQRIVNLIQQAIAKKHGK